MQSTPRNKRGVWWTIQLETNGYFRSSGMCWGRCADDPYHRYGDLFQMKYGNADEALFRAKEMGWEVDLIYPHQRYHQTKSYADNLAFKKENASDVEDEDEINL